MRLKVPLSWVSLIKFQFTILLRLSHRCLSSPAPHPPLCLLSPILCCWKATIYCHLVTLRGSKSAHDTPPSSLVCICGSATPESLETLQEGLLSHSQPSASQSHTCASSYTRTSKVKAEDELTSSFSAKQRFQTTTHETVNHLILAGLIFL